MPRWHHHPWRWRVVPAIALLMAPFSTGWLGWPAQFVPVVLSGSVLLSTLSGLLAGALSAHRAAVTKPGIAIAG
ncbi:hypothetical protein HXX25_13250 [Hyphobacterium sp. CCMP332]|uniref:hypothetical protein n=1 Tax=Hyphobacterium sp. CCMP332 TaxID=2749086 RepID=UPI0016507BEB|nr:hypothetical protein [Hyphobacterium sp. CCMP332]QNL20210.1 hypothetical protein HXX25_13250 [Hyphobacterium sp. CCMP332]